MKCRIADFNVEILCRGRHLQKICKNYFADFDKADFGFKVLDEDIEKELSSPYVENRQSAESLAACRKLLSFAADKDAFLLHAAVFEVGGRGIALIADSGTGKSTHMLLWQKLLGEKFSVINGDKPIVRIFDSVPYAYGTPWCGKEGLTSTKKVALTDLCFIKRSEENKTVKIEKGDAAKRLWSHVMLPRESSKLLHMAEMLDKTVKNCNVWEIYCNTDISAAEEAQKAIFRGETYET